MSASATVRRRQLQGFLQRTPKGVVLLEGKEDPPILLALLGAAVEESEPGLYIVDGVGIRGLGGREHVEGILAIAADDPAAAAKVHGVVDGDGQTHAELAAKFDPPFAGPLFSWKTYSIENLLVRAAWPAAWGTAPTWAEAMQPYAPYVAIGRLQREVQTGLASAFLEKLKQPGDVLLATQDVHDRLVAFWTSIQERPLGAWFRRELEAFEKLLAEPGLDGAHALLNGKWLVEHFASTRTKKSPAACRAEWIEAARQAGGLQEVKDLWARMWPAPPGP